MTAPRYVVRRDGEWFRIPRHGHDVACCDCGLVHRFKARLRGRSIEINLTRMPRATGGHRAALKKSKKRK